MNGASKCRVLRESGLSPVSKRLAPPSQPEMATHRVKGQQDVNNQGATAARSLSFDEDTPPTWFLCFFDDFGTRMQELLSTKLKEHEEQIEGVRFDMEQAKGKIKALEDNTQKLIDKLEDLENRSRSNNVILHGVPETDNEDCRETVTGLLRGGFKTQPAVDRRFRPVPGGWHCLEQ